MKSAPKAPAQPDPVATAQAQGAVNKETAIANARLNNVDQYTPYGSLTYSETGASADGTPKFRSDIALSPEQQQLLNLGNKGDIGTAQLGVDQLGRINNAVSTPFSYGGLGDAPTADTMAQAQDKGQAAVMARLQPQWTHDQAALDTKLSNQGIQHGSEAYDDAYRQFNNAKTDAEQQAVLTGQQYAAQGQNDALARRQQNITEYGAQRNAPLNEYSALTSGTQVQNPTFNNTNYTGSQPADLAGNIYKNYQGDINAYNQKVATNNANTGALFQLGGMAAGAYLGRPSDIRLKTAIERCGTLLNGLPVYSYRYLGDATPHIGLMAQDVLKVMPEAVMTQHGYYAVDYGMVLNG